MRVEEWASLGGAVGIVPALQWLWRRVARDPKVAAETRKIDVEARKLDVEADNLVITQLYAHIERLDREIGALRKQLSDERTACDRQIKDMEGQIRQLQQRQTSAGRMARNQAEGPLHTAFPVTLGPDQDDDLLGKLDGVPGTDGRSHR
jgi:hypothetical protein